MSSSLDETVRAMLEGHEKEQRLGSEAYWYGIRTSYGGRPRQTKCARGHELAGDNLLVRIDEKGRERRRCRICRNAWIKSPAIPPASGVRSGVRTGVATREE